MKAKSRKRLLISSIAMLLVAMLALGTATFAWFTQNTTATADTLYATTVKASSLKISKYDHAWANSVSYTLGASDSPQIMFPASSANGTTWCEAISDNATTGVYKASTAKAVTPARTTSKFVYKDQLNVQNAGTAGAPAINNVKISVTWPASTAAYARFALVPTDSADFDSAAFDFETGKSFKDYVYAQSAVTYDGRSDNTTTQSITTKTGDITIGTLNAGEAKYFTLFVWFEGQDAACVDNNAGQLINGMKFTVTGTPAAN